MGLLTDMWAGEGRKCIVRINSEWKGPSHRWFGTTSEALRFVKHGPNGKGHGKGTDIYFACSLYGSEDAGRVATNASTINAFWLDIDVGKKPEQPQTKREAISELKRLCAEAQLPDPWYVVDSGTGYHVYWRCRPMGVKDWRKQATTLDRLCQESGVVVDTSRTSDAASILRVPGTLHTKSGRKVKVVAYNPNADILVLPESEIKHFERNEWMDDTPSHSPHLPIVQHCAQMRHIHDEGGDVEEPLRYAALQLLRHTDWEDHRPYEDLFHAVTHYDPADEVPRKMRQLESRAVGPTTCARFLDANPEGCSGCPHFEKITSPIQLGLLAATSDAPSTDPVSEPDLPTKIGKFQINDQGVSYYDADEGAPVKILHTPLRIEYLGRVLSSGAIAVLTWLSLKGKRHECELPMIALADRKELSRVLHKNLIPFVPGKEPLIMNYLIDTANRLQAEEEPEIIARRFGWTDDGVFVVGDDAISRHGVEKTRLTATVSSQLVTSTQSAGSLDQWISTTSAYQDGRHKPQAFALLCAFGAPLLKLMNLQGAVVSLAGPSGTGKTTGIRHAMSVFGSPTSLLLSGRPTITAQIDMLRTANNIAVGMDDVTVSRMRELKDMVYMAANGQSRERASRDGTMRERDTWQTVLLLSTNSQLMKMPDIVSDAERRRIVEIGVDHNHRIDRRKGSMINDTITNHYGVVGRKYIELVIKNKDKVLDLADRYRQRMWDGIADEYRFGIWMCAAALSGGLLAWKKGLIDFDPRPAVNYALASLRYDAALEHTASESIEILVTEYIRENAGCFTSKRGRKFDWTELGRMKVAGTINYDNDMIYIPVRKLEQYIRDNDGSLVSFTTWRKDNDIKATAQLLIPTKQGGRAEHCIALPHKTHEGDTDE